MAPSQTVPQKIPTRHMFMNQGNYEDPEKNLNF